MIDAAPLIYEGRMEPGRPEATRYHVVPGLDEGWDVVVEDEHHNVSSTHCSDWHRVERICAALEHKSGPRLNDQERTKDEEEITH
jgi:hypothetical protein